MIPQEETVPAGDCIIMEFGPERDRTDKLCDSYAESGAREVSTVTEDGQVIELGEAADNEPSPVKSLDGIETVSEDEDA